LACELSFIVVHHFHHIGNRIRVILVPVGRIIGGAVQVLVPVPIGLSGRQVLDHTGGIDQVIPPVLVAVAVGITRCLQLHIGEQVIEIDLPGRDDIGVRVDRDKILLAAAGGQKRDTPAYDHRYDYLYPFQNLTFMLPQLLSAG
jgi:hypothetical protein